MCSEKAPENADEVERRAVTADIVDMLSFLHDEHLAGVMQDSIELVAIIHKMRSSVFEAIRQREDQVDDMYADTDGFMLRFVTNVIMDISNRGILERQEQGGRLRRPN